MRELSKEQEEACQEVLTHVRKDYPSAFIGGGCLRDWLMGHEPKDIDVFIFEALNGDDLTGEVPAHLYPGIPRILGVSGNKDLGVGLPVQIIQLCEASLKAPTPLYAVRQFSMGIQAVYYTDRLRITPNFYYDVIQQCMTVQHCESVLEAKRILQKIGMLRDRYPGWRLIVPDEFKLFFLSEAWKDVSLNGLPLVSGGITP